MFRQIILAVMVLAVFASAELVFAQEEEAGVKERQKRRGQSRRFEQDRPVDRPGQRGARPMAQRQGALGAGLDRWLGELTEAYREKDNEKMGQLLRRMNQARRKVQQRRQQFGLRERGFLEGQGKGRGRMRRGKGGQTGPRAGRMERFAPPMGDRGPVERPRRGGGGQGMGRRQGGAIGRPGRGMGAGSRRQTGAMGRSGRDMGRGGQGFQERDRRMLRLREHADERFYGMGRRQGWRDNRRGFMPPRGSRW